MCFPFMFATVAPFFVAFCIEDGVPQEEGGDEGKLSKPRSSSEELPLFLSGSPASQISTCSDFVVTEAKEEACSIF